MSTNYATERMTAAIQKHLLSLDLIPPTEESTRVATELTEVVWTELRFLGLSRETLENFFAAGNQTRAQGKV